MTTVHIDASPEARHDRLSALGAIARATGWERAALVAAEVRLSAQGQANLTSEVSPEQFAARGLAGLRSPQTVRLYVQRWLDAHDGEYPQPGTTVTLPSEDWPPTRTGTNGANSEAGLGSTIAAAIERHGRDTVAAVIAEQDEQLAAAVESRVINDRASTGTNLPPSPGAEEMADLVDRNRDRATARRTGTEDVDAQAVHAITERLMMAMVAANAADRLGSSDLVNKLRQLVHLASAWLESIDGSAPVAWSDNDRSFATELGIDLGVSA